MDPNPYQSPRALDPTDGGVPAEALKSDQTGDFVAVYAARNLPEAQLLCDLLADEGIRAEVTNKLLEGGSGVDIVGWPTLPRVVVDRADAVRARELALEFDRRAVAAAKQRDYHREEDLHSQAAQPQPVERPACPQCGRGRITRCPVCQTASNAFPPADVNPPAPSVDVFNPATAATGMACGPGGCCTTGCGTDAAATNEPAEELPAGLLLCTTCDEAFQPEYARRCEWCGHEFPDGYAVDPPSSAVEVINVRMAVTIFALLGLLAAILAYFRWVV